MPNANYTVFVSYNMTNAITGEVTEVQDEHIAGDIDECKLIANREWANQGPLSISACGPRGWIFHMDRTEDVRLVA